MPTVILVITAISLTVTTGQNIAVIVRTAKTVHHHFTHPIYTHTIKPVVKAVKNQ